MRYRNIARGSLHLANSGQPVQVFHRPMPIFKKQVHQLLIYNANIMIIFFFNLIYHNNLVLITDKKQTAKLLRNKILFI